MRNPDSWLRELGKESAGSSEAMLGSVYEELRRLAARKMSDEKSGHTLQATALVHEAWLRLSGSKQAWRDSDHFFSAAAEAMRRILVDNARRKISERRGGRWQRTPFDELELAIVADDEKCLQVSEALDELARVDPERAEVVKLRVFVGLTISEIAKLQGCSEKTVQRDWTFARAWLSRELGR